MAVAPPPPLSFNPARRIATHLRDERRSRRRASLPPGELSFSLARTRRFAADPLGTLLDFYRRFGPVFTVRVLHLPVVVVLGPEANRHLLIENARNFHWREGSMGDLIPLLGDGLLTIDGEPHHTARRIMLPAFHHERVAAAGATMLSEAQRALDELDVGARVDLYAFMRRLTLRIAMRALFGFSERDERAMAETFERALRFYSRDYLLQILRGPATPWAAMRRARRELDAVIDSEVARRRASDERDGGLLSLLLDGHDEAGRPLPTDQIRDQVMTLLFAGHDTATSTVTFLMYELSRHPRALEAVVAEQDRVLPGGRPPTGAELLEGLPQLEMALDETLRLWPPAWVGPRRAVDDFELHGHRIPGGSFVEYCSWASHRLPDVFPDPEAFVPERFAPEARAALPKGAYVPFGGGSRMCIGMRFGQAEVKAIATLLLQRFRPELDAGYRLRVRQMPTLSPRDGLPVVLRPRAG
ncbi:MAG: cytochrome P450 [Solirubrobacteraceae bacterium]|nr:MAG: cytochrome P450 [Solirubrobacterales bacterium]